MFGAIVDDATKYAAERTNTHSTHLETFLPKVGLIVNMI